jgi:1,2-dihydroxy-3-keto-5-methylthiopentene dioxygenase
MTVLTIYPDHDPHTVLAHYEDFAAIERELAAIGIEFEHWPTPHDLPEKPSPAQVLAAYASEIQRFVDKYGFQSQDVVGLTPDHPQKDAMRDKFLHEHVHDDFEIRFFVEGEGVFYIRKNSKVFATLCQKGDLINLPAGTTHWFDMGPNPRFQAIRLFTTPEGWVARFTGDTIADTFPKHEN